MGTDCSAYRRSSPGSSQKDGRGENLGFPSSRGVGAVARARLPQPPGHRLARVNCQADAQAGGMLVGWVAGYQARSPVAQCVSTDWGWLLILREYSAYPRSALCINAIEHWQRYPYMRCVRYSIHHCGRTDARGACELCEPGGLAYSFARTRRCMALAGGIPVTVWAAAGSDPRVHRPRI